MNTGKDFIFIEDAINDPATSDGHTIVVENGVYRENVRVTKSLTIRSENGSANCAIQDARRNDHVVTVTADCVNVSGFTVSGATSRKAGIYLNAGYCNVSTNNCSNDYIGIHLDGSHNNIISGNDCSSNGGEGVRLDSSSNNHISSNNCLNNQDDGIYISGSSNSAISGNNCSNNGWAGINLDGSSNNNISRNDCSDGEAGISLSGSSDNELTGNIMFKGGIVIEGGLLSDYTHEIDETNTVNGKPVYYWKDVDGERIPDGAGQVILVNCSDVLVEEQNLNDLDTGITVAFSSHLTLKDNNCSNNVDGIRLYESGNNHISDNTCSNHNYNGISLIWFKQQQHIRQQLLKQPAWHQPL